MYIDGVFLHYLIDEISNNISGYRISKLYVINNYKFCFLFQSKKCLCISLNSNSSRIWISSNEILKSNITTPFFTLLKKYCEGSIIQSIEQIDNDRIVLINLLHFDELGYQTKIKLIIELFGRNSNCIITDDNYLIVDCYKRLVPNDLGQRVLLPKVKWKKEINNRINPYTLDLAKINTKDSDFHNQYEGVSTICFNEIVYTGDFTIIQQNVKPTFIECNNKYFFYSFPLSHLGGETKSFNYLSELLEYYYGTINKDYSLSNEQNAIRQHLDKNIKKAILKRDKQIKEKETASDHLKYEKIGHLLSSNLHKITKKMNSVNVYDYYNNTYVEIPLNPLLSASQNMEYYYHKYKKAKRTLDVIDEQISKTNNEIDYYQCLLEQMSLAKTVDLNEIAIELNIRSIKNKKLKNQKPNITSFKTKSNCFVYVGKNNIQNNYLTHTFADKNDYFFHVQGYSGSHTILKGNNITDNDIKLAATIASYYSKSRESHNVAVDYTQIKYVKKIPKTLGSFVTYTNQKTIFVNPSLEIINDNTTKLQ